MSSSAGSRIASRIHKARKDAGLDIPSLAKKIGTLIRTVRAYEDGILVPDLHMLERIAMATGTTSAWLTDTGAVVNEKSYPTPAQIAEDGGYPPSLVEALSTTDGLFAARLRNGMKLLFGGARLVGDGNMWVQLTGVPDIDLGLSAERSDGQIDVDVRLDEIVWVCDLTPSETPDA